MEQLFDYKMVENRPVVEHAHEIQALAKELEQFPFVLPDKFVAGGIVAKPCLLYMIEKTLETYSYNSRDHNNKHTKGLFGSAFSEQFF
jgi:hypothetical protein